MKSGLVFSIATAVGLTFATVITAFAHHGWSQTGARAADHPALVRHVDPAMTAAIAD